MTRAMESRCTQRAMGELYLPAQMVFGRSGPWRIAVAVVVVESTRRNQVQSPSLHQVGSVYLEVDGLRTTWTSFASRSSLAQVLAELGAVANLQRGRQRGAA